MKLDIKERRRFSEQAALHLIRLHGHGSESECPEDLRKDFLEFSRLSAHHVHELLITQAVWKELETIDPERAIDVHALPTLAELADSLSESDLFAANDGPTTTQRAVRPSFSWRWPLAAAASIAVAAGGWLIASTISGEPTYVTAVGEQRSIKLDDGSVMLLNTGSRARVSFSDSTRQIELIDGEALFTVYHDPARPFEVATDAGTIVAVGTQFNVYRRAGATRVSVIEGIVRIAPSNTELHAGDEAVMDGSRTIKTSNPDITRVTAWRTRQLVFRDSALADVVEQFNRYNRVQIRLEGAELQARSVSGVFDADDVEPLVDFLAGDARLTVTRSDGRILIKARGADADSVNP